MKRILALALVGSFAFVAFGDDPKPAPKETKSCGMACCKKNNTTCKDCPDCKKAREAAAAKDATKK